MITRWDIVEGHYWYCVTHHKGQGSSAYRRISKILSYYTPSPSVERGELSEGAWYVYDRLSN